MSAIRVLALVPRYGDSVVGGSEEYLRRVLPGLAATGVEVEILTTCDPVTTFHEAGGISWPNALARGVEPGPPRLERYRCLDLPARARRWLTRLSERGYRASLEAEGALPDSSFGPGFHELELWADGPARWTSGTARLSVADGTRRVLVRVVAFHDVSVTARARGRTLRTVSLAAGVPGVLELSLLGGETEIRLEAEPCVRPTGDGRLLGVAVREVEVEGPAAGRLALERDWREVSDELPTAELARRYDAMATGWGRVPGLADALLKGPLSARLAASALRRARQADVVLASNAPFSLLPLGLGVARLSGKPFAALPFFHLRDPYHHRPAVRLSLARADRVLCLSEAMARFVDQTLGGRGAVVGAGVDPVELSSPEISGERFRSRHGLGTEPVVLTLARKTPSKGYGTVARAVRRLRERGTRCRWVFIGPDEDGVPIPPEDGLYLGQRSRAEVLDALDACDVLALTSVFESFGIVYVEAWMRGKPVVGDSRADSVALLVEPGVDGELVRGEDGLVAALDALLGDPSRRRALGEAGRKKALARFTWEVVVGRVAEELRDLARGSACR